MDSALLWLLNGLSYGLLLFMLSAGLTIVFSLLGVLNFAHASFYMLGAYVAWTLSPQIGFGAALLLAPLAVGLAGAAFERGVLRRLRVHGHVPELLATFGLAYVVVEAVQLVWGRAPLAFDGPAWLQQPALTLVWPAHGGVELVAGRAAPAQCAAPASCLPYPATRALSAAVALLMLAASWLALRTSRVGLVIRAALTQPRMVQSLGHDVQLLFTAVFGGGCALAALAGVIGGASFVTEPSMAAAMGPLVFVVVVVGGLGSLPGALLASLLIGLLQTFAVAADRPLLGDISLAQVAPLLPYLLMVGVLLWRPRGLFGGPAQGDAAPLN